MLPRFSFMMAFRHADFRIAAPYFMITRYVLFMLRHFAFAIFAYYYFLHLLRHY